MEIEDQFDKIVQDMLVSACGVKCSAEDYRAGLRSIVQEIETAISASHEDTNGDV